MSDEFYSTSKDSESDRDQLARMLAALSDSNVELELPQGNSTRDSELKQLQESLEHLGAQLTNAVNSASDDEGLEGLEIEKLFSFTDRLPHLVEEYRESEQPPAREAQEELLIGRELASCVIIERLGSGGMGTVYLGRHLNLGKKVAIKVLPASRSANPRAISRFKREMRAIGGVEDPHVVNALGAGVDGNVHYLVMEYVCGIDVGYLLKSQGRLGLSEVCEIIRQAALGLSAIHEAGLVHRDLKPSNLMVDESGCVKVLDLGLAHLSDPNEDELTRTGSLMGTLDYMAPEQSEDSSQVDYRADMYSLGATFYKLLTGETPLSSYRQGSALSRFRAFIELSVPSVGEKRSELPPEIIDVVDSLLQKVYCKKFQKTEVTMRRKLHGF